MRVRVRLDSKFSRSESHAGHATPQPNQSEIDSADRLFSGRESEMRNAKGRTETGSLKDEGYEAFHPPLIRSVLVGKLLEHEFFLVA